MVPCEHHEPHWKEHCELAVDGAKYVSEPNPSGTPIVTWRGMHEMEAPSTPEALEGENESEDRQDSERGRGGSDEQYRSKRL